MNQNTHVAEQEEPTACNCEHCQNGETDYHTSEPQKVDGIPKQAEFFTKERCLKMAAIEGDQEVGAGKPITGTRADLNRHLCLYGMTRPVEFAGICLQYAGELQGDLDTQTDQLRELQTALGKLKTDYEAQTALIIQMRQIASSCQYCDNEGIQYDFEGNKEPCESCFFRLNELKALTPSQAETALKNKHIQECIEVLEKIPNEFKQHKDWANAFYFGVEKSVEALQALIKEV